MKKSSTIPTFHFSAKGELQKQIEFALKEKATIKVIKAIYESRDTKYSERLKEIVKQCSAPWAGIEFKFSSKSSTKRFMKQFPL